MPTTSLADDPGREATAGPPRRATPGRRFLIGLAVITAVALIVRVAYVWLVWRHRPIVGDPLYYHIASNLLADGKGFINPYALAGGVTRPGADHPPLYIVYLSVFSFAGIRSVTGHMLASCLLGAASVAVGGFAGRRVAGPRVGLIAAALLAVYPNVWRFDAMVLSESLVILVVNVTILLAYRYWDRPGTGRLVAVGASIAVCALARSELLLLVPLLLVPLALVTRSRPWPARWAELGLAALTCAAILAPWVGFNLSRFDHPVLLSGQMEVTLADANCDPVYYGPKIGYWEYDCGGVTLASKGLTGPNVGGRDERAMRQGAIDYIRAHASRLPVVAAARVARILNLWPPSNAVDRELSEANPTRVAWLSVVTLWPIMIAAVVGAVVLRRRRVLLIPLLAPIATVIVTVLLFYASSRFRATAEGALCLLAAVALEAAWVAWSSRRRAAVG